MGTLFVDVLSISWCPEGSTPGEEVPIVSSDFGLGMFGVFWHWAAELQKGFDCFWEATNLARRNNAALVVVRRTTSPKAICSILLLQLRVSQPVSADICAIRFPTDIGLAAFFALTRMKPHAKEGPLEEKSLRCFGYLGPGGRMILVEAQLVLQLP